MKQEVKKLDGAEQQQLFYAFRSAMNNPNFRQILQNASKPENVKLLIEKVPGLAEDHVALSMLQDWELMLHLADPKIVQALVEKHPSMALAAKEIISTVPGMLQQQSGSSSSARRAQAGWLARSLGADDDESMDQAPPAQQNAGLSITPAQLAAALNFAQNNLRCKFIDSFILLQFPSFLSFISFYSTSSINESATVISSSTPTATKSPPDYERSCSHWSHAGTVYSSAIVSHGIEPDGTCNSSNSAVNNTIIIIWCRWQQQQ